MINLALRMMNLVFKMMNFGAAAHEAAILSDGTDCEPADVPASATDVYVKDCTEVRRSMAPLATGAELELVAASRTYRLCAVTRSDSGAWGRVLHAALQPDFGISSAKKKLRRAVRVRCCLLCIYMPAIDRSLSALYIHAGD